MTERWERVERLFHELRELDTAERGARLAQACGGDAELRTELESLLASADRPLEVLEESPLGGSFSLADATPLEALPDPWIGRQVGAFRIEEAIGTGGMGTVYRGARCDGVLEQDAAIKLLHPWRRTEELLRRFQAEWQLLARLRHPNIAQVIDAGLLDDGTPYLAMELVDGVPVDEYCDAQELAVDRRLALFETIAHTVHFAHQNLVVHRDLKPANILVTSGGVPKLLDFGIAKVLEPEHAGGAGADPTATRSRLMTPDYASPEQLRGESVTTATDVYSLGVLLYELLTGRRPHRRTTTSLGPIEPRRAGVAPPRPSSIVLQPPTGETPSAGPAELARRRRSSARRLRRLLRGDLDNVVLMAMREEPHRRYASAENLARDVRRHLDGLTVVARPDTALYRLSKFVARNRLTSAAAGLAAIAVVVGAVTTSWQARIAAQERNAARAAERQAEDEADHARIEADSALKLVDFMVDSFLVSAPQRTEAELDAIRLLLQRHLVAVRREHAEHDHLRANLLDALGRIHLHVNLFDEAEELIEEAAAIREREFTRESLEFALSLSSLGDLAWRRGELATAAEHFAEALARHRRLPIGVHTDVAQAANNLAVLQRLLGRVEEARALHEEALALRVAGGAPHLVAESLNNLSAIHMDAGEYDAAVEKLERALAIRREYLGEEHPLVAQTLNNLATIEANQGNLDTAEARMGEAVALYRRIPGVDPSGLAGALTNHALVLRMQGRGPEAREHVQEALDLRRALFGSDEHPEVLDTLAALADVEHALGDHDAARRHFEELIAGTRRLYPAGHRKLGQALGNFGAVLVRSGAEADAEAPLLEAVAILAAAEPVDHVFLGAAEYHLGVGYRRRELPDEAEAYLLSAYERFEERAESRAKQTARELYGLYTELGLEELAAEYAQE